MRNDFLRFIVGIENGTSDHEKLAKLAGTLDPVLIFFALRYIREKYPVGDPRGSGVTERLVELTTNHPQLIKASKKGATDSLVEWFDDTYTLRTYFTDLEGFADLIVEKFDS